jgi:RimJ/RimL family protein N-acetyltransferase
MAAAEHLASEIGFTELSLNVFGFNERARRLYDSMDYRVVAVQMTKALALDPVAFGIAARA